MAADETAQLDAARHGDEAAFRAIVEPWRRELLAQLYRLSGSLHEAEDLVQETMVRAWNGIARFEGRSSIRTWLHRIATNVALNAIEARRARRLPGAEPPGDATTAPPAPIADEWLEPFPDSLLPDQRLQTRESVALALVEAMQSLPARQRVVLLAREVLELSAEETAELVDASVASANSLLQRARETISAQAASRRAAAARAADDAAERAIVERYLQAWESSDAQALLTVLRDDARLTMPPLPLWFRGARAIADAVSRFALGTARWRLVPLRANGAPAFAVYELGADGSAQARAIHVLGLEDGGVETIHAFLDPTLVPRFGLATRLPR